MATVAGPLERAKRLHGSTPHVAVQVQLPRLQCRLRRLLLGFLHVCSFRCSETGAKFFADYFSKHAMHSAGAEEVLYAGKLAHRANAGWAG